MSVTWSHRVLLGSLALVVAMGLGAPAWAHGDVQGSTPREGATLKQSPDSVVVQLAEPPAAGSDLAVLDGCRRQVSGEARIVAGSNLIAPVSGGEPGRWQVRVRSLSSVDGHLVSERFSFSVRGKKDCEGGDDEEPTGDPTEDVELGEPQPPLQNDETSFPVVPFAIGTLVLVGGALVVRRFGSRG